MTGADTGELATARQENRGGLGEVRAARPVSRPRRRPGRHPRLSVVAAEPAGRDARLRAETRRRSRLAGSAPLGHAQRHAIYDEAELFGFAKASGVFFTSDTDVDILASYAKAGKPGHHERPERRVHRPGRGSGPGRAHSEGRQPGPPGNTLASRGAAWTVSAATAAGFPRRHADFVKRARDAGWCETRGSLRGQGASELLFWMPDEHRRAILDLLISRFGWSAADQPGGANRRACPGQWKVTGTSTTPCFRRCGTGPGWCGRRTRPSPRCGGDRPSRRRT